MSYKVLNKTPVFIDGQVVETTVDMRQDEPYTVLRRSLDGDHTKTTDDKLIDLVLQKIHDETTTKVDILQKLKDVEFKVENLDNVMEHIELISGAFEELAIIVFEGLEESE